MDRKARRAPAPRSKTARVAETPETTPASIPPRRAVCYQPDEAFDRKRPLSFREKDILHHIVAGTSYAEIAAAFRSSTRTVETHVTHIFQKLNVDDRHAAAALYRDWEAARLKQQIKDLEAQVRARDEKIAALRRELRKRS